MDTVVNTMDTVVMICIAMSMQWLRPRRRLPDRAGLGHNGAAARRLTCEGEDGGEGPELARGQRVVGWDEEGLLDGMGRSWNGMGTVRGVRWRTLVESPGSKVQGPG